MPLDSANVFYTFSLGLVNFLAHSTVLLNCTHYFVRIEMIDFVLSTLVKWFFLYEDIITCEYTA